MLNLTPILTDAATLRTKIHDKAATALKANGAKKVVAYCTHPVLSGPAVERVNDSDLDALVVTDTIPLRDDAAGSPPDGLVQTHTFTRGFHISEICGTRLDSGAQLCASANELSAFYAVWMRPNTETVLTMLRPDGSYVAAAKGVVYLRSQDQTARRAICFSGLGQVSVATSTCP